MTSQAVARLAVAALVGLAACGDGGDDREIVRLAVGYRAGDEEGTTRGFIVRNTGAGWVPVAEELMDDRSVTSVLFASGTVAWAYGDRLLRSTDAGLTWADVEDKLDVVLNGPHALQSAAFADATTGYLATYRADEGPFVWVTRDGGESWSSIALETRPQEVGFALGVRGGVAEILRHALAAPGAIVEPIDGAHFDTHTVTTLPSFIRSGFETVGERGWIAFAVIPNDDLAQSRPVVMTSARPGAPWTEQPLPDVISGDFGAFDMCDDSVGIVGGIELNFDFTPFVFHTGNGGGEWGTSVLHGREPEFELADLLCVNRGEMYAATKNFPDFASALFASKDGGRNFDRVSFLYEDRSQLVGLASNAAQR